MKNKRGITLIALVITIIVLLILAGVTVATLTGENRLLSKAATAKERTIEGEQDEKDKLSAYENELSNYTRAGDNSNLNNTTITETILYNRNNTDNIDSFELTENIDGYQYIKIYYMSSNKRYVSETEVINNGVCTALMCTGRDIYDNQYYEAISTKDLTISGKNCTLSNAFEGLIYTGSNKTWGSTSNDITVYKIKGYK